MEFQHIFAKVFFLNYVLAIIVFTYIMEILTSWLSPQVVSFFGGNDQYEEPVDEKLESIPEEEGEESKTVANKRKLKSKKQLEEADTRGPTLPFVDSYSQVAWRQNIVLEKVMV